MVDFIIDGDRSANWTFVFAHGSGAAMDSVFMQEITDGLVAQGICVARFEFAYMAGRRRGGSKRPPPKMPVLEDEFRDALAELQPTGGVIIGGKSMGGRVASLIGGDLYASGAIHGVVCLGYPFHPQGKPEKLRTAHLEDLDVPTLICQGTRDPFGTSQEVSGYALSEKIEVAWFEDGDHDLKPRKRVTGMSHEAQLGAVCDRVTGWIKGVAE
ncbi:alpha/beta family hydrolase [Shimia haliotis]|uniref:KANL3/Tex30 alpha/beta hydrolase-like domain-containing protein n=1 Tax=Shimia haliotis TaxID=1280847 RepID=A0A1I4F0M8_9RHOB|nr:alpha/beta family hydrolase [Shimia haliotis]SFL10880.1 hypothetical protein SAMN04488036_10587 [Shimia haliotis]